jgi:predicted TIM-barrel fold metal-dependent hydrolase
MIDACVHPVVANPTDIGAYLPAAYRRHRLPLPGNLPYPLPIDHYVAGSVPERTMPIPRTLDGSTVHLRASGSPEGEHGARASNKSAPPLPGSDPELLDARALRAHGGDHAILLPLTRGRVLDAQFDAAIASGTNEWLAETWLGEWNTEGRFKGSIRVCPRVPDAAVREIERWAPHEHFVQVAVPLEAYLPYGEPCYFPIWEAAANHGLPVAVHSDPMGGLLLPPTPLGNPAYALDLYSQQPMYTVTHLASIIGHGVFDRLEPLVFVFADGGFDYMSTLMWRLDKDWRATRSEVPWMDKAPSKYLEHNVRYVIHRGDGIDDPEQYARFIELNDLASVLLFGSNYPNWDYLDADELAASLPDTARDAIMDGNARTLYGLARQSVHLSGT